MNGNATPEPMTLSDQQRQMTMKRISKDDAWLLARAITRIPALLRRD
jgi:hypothetical protein